MGGRPSVRILITGAGGFIGSHLMDALYDDHTAIGVDNFLTGRIENRIGVVRLDITDRDYLYEVANKVEPDVVIHCAASYSDPDKWHRDTDTNVAGCINAAAVAKHHGAHLIYFQTILPPVSSYAISKIAGEQYLRLSGVPLTVLRLANIYGPRNLSGPIPVFYKRLTEGLPVMVVDTTRDMVFIDDLVRAVQIVVEEGIEGTFDVCSGIQTPIFRMYELVMEELGIARMSYPLIPPDPDDVQGTVSRENRVPGWYSHTVLASGIHRTIESYRETPIDNTYTHLRIGEKDAS
jgi:UDP-glucose 4-epimerase